MILLRDDSVTVTCNRRPHFSCNRFETTVFFLVEVNTAQKLFQCWSNTRQESLKYSKYRTGTLTVFLII